MEVTDGGMVVRLGVNYHCKKFFKSRRQIMTTDKSDDHYGANLQPNPFSFNDEGRGNFIKL
jgi:hypothetical protein